MNWRRAEEINNIIKPYLKIIITWDVYNVVNNNEVIYKSKDIKEVADWLTYNYNFTL